MVISRTYEIVQHENEMMMMAQYVKKLVAMFDLPDRRIARSREPKQHPCIISHRMPKIASEETMVSCAVATSNASSFLNFFNGLQKAVQTFPSIILFNVTLTFDFKFSSI